MVQAEVEEAIREWLHRRGISAEKNEIEFRIKLVFEDTRSQRAFSHGALIQGPVLVDVMGIELPPKDGPFR
jgi:hypothetical protein